MLLYAISDRRSLSGGENERRMALLGLVRKWVQGGVDYIQVREKDLSAEHLHELAAAIVNEVRSWGTGTRVLLNGPAAIALKAGADGVHLPGNSPQSAAEEAQRIFAGGGREALISRACHSMEDVRASTNVSMVLFAPVFEKVLEEKFLEQKARSEKIPVKKIAADRLKPGLGLDALSQACRTAGSVPVFALGGVTRANARSCEQAGAAGIAAIRLFLDDDWRGLR